MSKYKGMVRVWGYVPEEVNADILSISEREQRAPANVISILLQAAIKERNRKKKKVAL